MPFQFCPNGILDCAGTMQFLTGLEKGFKSTMESIKTIVKSLNVNLVMFMQVVLMELYIPIMMNKDHQLSWDY